MSTIRALLPTLLVGGLLLSSADFAAEGTGRWITGAPMPSERSEVAVTEVGGKIYVIGGVAGQQELEIYNLAAGRWSRGAAIPQPLHHAGG